MTILESIKDQWRQVMEKPKKERWAYFWDYYKWHTIITLLVIAALVQGIISLATRKEIVFTGYVLNCSVADSDDDFWQGFCDYAGIDSSEQEVAVYTDLYLRNGQELKNAEVFSRVMAGISTQEADFIIGQSDTFQPFAYHTSKIFVDLREFFDAETLEKYADRLYYIDGVVLEQLSKPVGQEVGPIIYPDPRNPKVMEDPIPVGIDVSDLKNFRSVYYAEPDTTVPNPAVYIGIIASTARPELTQQLIDYLFS